MWISITSLILVLVVAGLLVYGFAGRRLFDIRFIAARSLAYTLLVTILGALYVGIIFGSTQILSSDTSSPNDIIPFVAALLVAATAPLFKRAFDKITNRLFFRDSYDPQGFLNELNHAIASNIEVGILLRRVASVIEENIKCQFCLIAIKDLESGKLKIRNESKVTISAHDLDDLRQELLKRGQIMAVTAEIDNSEGELKKVLVENNLAIVRPLVEEYYQTKEAVAYLVLGPKKSGKPYSVEDIKIIDIIADELLIAIQNSLRFEEIQQFNVLLQERIEEATAKLRRTNQKLKEMDDTKDEFISMASHQLRTPLTSVKGYVSMVLEGDAGKISPLQRQLLGQAFSSSQRMVYLIADLLNVSRLKTGKFVINPVESYLPDVIQSEIDQLKEAFSNKKLQITYTKPKDFPALMLDETKIRQVIMNYIDNAIYYTPSGGKIAVELKQDKKHLYFTVKDSGFGVPKNEQAHMFTKFYRASNARKARPDGSGLGLFMAKKVVVAQGGTILFESQEGKGSTFGFCFEIAKLLPKPATKPSS